MWYYRIADLVIAIDAVAGMPRMSNFEPFACQPAQPDISYRVHTYAPADSPVPDEQALELVSADMVNRTYMADGRMYKRVAMREGDARCMWFVQTLGQWSQADVYIPHDWLDYHGFGNVLSMEKTILPFGGLMLHCALIEYEGRGIVFTAPSQTGKSTQASLWEKHRGARTLNGDRAVLRATEDGIFAYGSPWAGSSDLYIDRRVPLRAVIMLEQAKENRIRTLSHAEGLGLFVQQSSLPLWEPELFEAGMRTLEKIITGVPMGMLSCLPDAGAVECVAKWIG
ncbi:MAG TPA: hypothetical protein IAA66_05660 [Candidatus Avichristensenella intestinipullorum]|uniref:SynChlorMet cassette protein ScmC n=1 Tax=Candidatus Avichristensenella intestinipullorum TaxID=2840693 RepID=A0A9D0YYB6_9FIRM|nr:hypothetical protein [Candidatus Avichristensenella intestinipullorum]